MQTTKQPQWKCVANLGDVNPLEYGGKFVYVDRTGQYPPEVESLEPIGDETSHDTVIGWEVRRMVLEPCTWIDGVLSDNRFHPTMPAWFADSLDAIASSNGQEVQDLIDGLTSDDPLARAWSWIAIADYHGWENVDSYPRSYTKRSELPRRLTRGRVQNGGK